MVQIKKASAINHSAPRQHSKAHAIRISCDCERRITDASDRRMERGWTDPLRCADGRPRQTREDGGGAAAWQPARGRARLKEHNVFMKQLDAERVRQQSGCQWRKDETCLCKDSHNDV